MKKFLLALLCLGSLNLLAMPPTHTFYDCSSGKKDGRVIVMHVEQGCFHRSYSIAISENGNTVQESCHVEDYANREVLLKCGPHNISFNVWALTLSDLTTGDSWETMTCTLREISEEIMPEL